METIALTVVSSIFTLIGFVPILWALSNGVRLPSCRPFPVRSLGVLPHGYWRISCVLVVSFKLPQLEYEKSSCRGRIQERTRQL